MCVVGRLVSKQPPLSMETSTSTEPGFIRDRCSRRTSFGAAAPKLVGRDLIRQMKPGSVVVDVAIDQGGCFETSRPTTHDDPTYVVDGVIHYCVANMPGGVPRTSAQALNNATLPFVLALADKGWRRALGEDPHLRAGLNVHDGRVTHPAVAEALGEDFVAPERAMAA